MRDAPLPRIKVTETAGGFRLLRRGRARRRGDVFPDATRLATRRGRRRVSSQRLRGITPPRPSLPLTLAALHILRLGLGGGFFSLSLFIFFAQFLVRVGENRARRDLDQLERTIGGVRLDFFDLSQRFHASHDATEDRVLAVEVRRRLVRDEKLRPVRILPSVRHAQHASVVVSERIILNLILERLSPYAVPSFARAGGVAALKHKVLDASMKLDVVVVSLLRERDEIFASSRRSIAV